MTKGMWRRSRDFNGSYRSRHRRKPMKGQGVYAHSLPGTPNGIHLDYAPKGVTCRCGGCNRRAA